MGFSLGSIASFAGDAFSAYAEHREADMQRDFNALEAQKNREFQERMANTQYQRMVADLNASGLSPMLAYSSAKPSTPSGSVASSGAMASGPRFGETESRASQSALARQQADLVKAQEDVARSQEQLNIQTAKKVAEDAKISALTVEQMPTRFYYDLANLGSQINLNSSSAKRTDIQATNDANLESPGTGIPIIRDLKNLLKNSVQAFESAKKNPNSWLNWGPNTRGTK